MQIAKIWESDDYRHDDEESISIKDASEPLLRMIGKADFIDLTLLPSKIMQEEIGRYFRYRGKHVSMNTIQHGKVAYKLFCHAMQDRRDLPDSLLGWEENRWVQVMKGCLLKKGLPLTQEKQSVYGTTHILDSRYIMFVKRLIRFLQPEDERPEREKDVWNLERLGIDIRQNPIYRTATMDFTGIHQMGIREEAKQAIFLHLKYESLGTVKREMSSLRQFSNYLQEQHKGGFLRGH